jgi:uncharacterized repeat protein (TIGR03806 family)
MNLQKHLLSILFLGLFACGQNEKPVQVIEETSLDVTQSSIGLAKLSDYNFFKGDLKNLEPEQNIIQYELNSALFSDYAFKKRFIKFPKEGYATYHPDDVFEFPEGTVLIKNFYYPADFRKPEENIRIIETRLLILENDNWKALPYVWNKEQTEAYLDIAGENINVSWVHFDGTKRSVLYSVPNMNQCKGCHERNDEIVLIGPTARQLNGVMKGRHENQLQQLAALGYLKNLPDLHLVPQLANYEDESASLNSRARAWLEVNCAHCHRLDGPAKTSGLHLLADVENSFELGIGKPPVAAGRGSGGLKYSIVPDNPDASILYYRINSTDPGVMMPELGRKLIHNEGVDLVREWISNLNK